MANQQRSRVSHVDTPRPVIRGTSRINIRLHPENRLRKFGPGLQKQHLAKLELAISGEGERSHALVKKEGLWTPNNPESACSKDIVSGLQKQHVTKSERGTSGEGTRFHTLAKRDGLWTPGSVCPKVVVPALQKQHLTRSETETSSEGEKSHVSAKKDGPWTPYNPRSVCPKVMLPRPLKVLSMATSASEKSGTKHESIKMKGTKTQLKEDNLKAHDGEKGDLRDTDSDEESSSSKRSREEMEEGEIDEEAAKGQGSSKKSRPDSGGVISKHEDGDTPVKGIQSKGRKLNMPVQYHLLSLQKGEEERKMSAEQKELAEDSGSKEIGGKGCKGHMPLVLSEKKTCKDFISKDVKGNKKILDDSTEDSDEDKEAWNKVVQRLTNDVNELEPVQSLSSQLQRSSPPVINQQYEQVQSHSSQLQRSNHPTGQPVFMHPWGLFPFEPDNSEDPRYQVWHQQQYFPYPFHVRPPRTPQPCPPRLPPGFQLPSASKGQVPRQFRTPPCSKIPVNLTGASGEGTIDSTPGYCRYTPPGGTGFVSPHEGYYKPPSHGKGMTGDGQFVASSEYFRGHVPEGKHIYFQSSDEDENISDDDDAEKEKENSSAKAGNADCMKIEDGDKLDDKGSTPARPKRKVYVPGKIKQMTEGRCDLMRFKRTEESNEQSFIGLIKKETSVSIYSQQEASNEAQPDQEKGQENQEFISFQKALIGKHNFHKDAPRSQRVARIQPRRRLTLQEEVMMESIPKELHHQFDLPSFSSPPNVLPSLRSDVIYPWSKEEYIDTHCHIDFLYQRLGFHGTFDKFGRVRNFPENYGGCVAVFCTPESFHPSNELWQNLLNEDKIWGAFGCHPHHVKTYDGVVETNIMQGMMHSKAVAFGEIGLDYSKKNTSDHILQHMVFKRQLALALKLQKPLVIHSRDAESDTLDIMVSMVPKDYKIHRHCFTGPPEEARAFLKAFPNSFIGITNLVTFPTAVETHRTAQEIPLDKILLETDAPYFLPRQCPRELRWSHPAMAVFVAEKIARLRGITTDEVLRAVRKNTREMYGI
ncbi:Deoxyribonuclease Tat-D [Holothuria leucospilota]|uniref:Deoxyribonuclease Tat-D n=1 Tax=Holothuria leucospilota TaxID=206669 RepID=A0A9Q1HIX5_HOLLE|nr:Deoxyribonuclease Tat-D [Holothuria leucospilota]